MREHGCVVVLSSVLLLPLCEYKAVLPLTHRPKEPSHLCRRQYRAAGMYMLFLSSLRGTFRPPQNWYASCRQLAGLDLPVQCVQRALMPAFGSPSEEGSQLAQIGLELFGEYPFDSGLYFCSIRAS